MPPPPPRGGRCHTVSKPLCCVKHACNSRCLRAMITAIHHSCAAASMTHSRSVVDTGLRKNCKYCDGSNPWFATASIATRMQPQLRAVVEQIKRHTEDCGLVGCSAVHSADSPTIRRSVPPPSSGSNKRCEWRLNIGRSNPEKKRHHGVKGLRESQCSSETSVSLQTTGVTTKETVHLIVAAVRTSNPEKRG